MTFVLILSIGVSDFFLNEQEAVNLSLANLLTFPFIRDRLESGRLQIYGMHYDFVEGKFVLTHNSRRILLLNLTITLTYILIPSYLLI